MLIVVLTRRSVIAAGMLVSGQFLEHKWEDTIQVQMVNVRR